jgi:hypothetical protein
VIMAGTLEWEIQLANRALAQSAALMEEMGLPLTIVKSCLSQ